MQSALDFAALGASPSVVAALAEGGIVVPTPVQAAVLPAALGGADVLAQAPTGTGKTLAFGVPLLERLEAPAQRPMTLPASPVGLVLVPTRELARQVFDELMPAARARRIRLATVTGGEPFVEQLKRVRRAEVLVATPGRLVDLVGSGRVLLGAVQILVLDEADRMLDMGFAEELERIVSELPTERQTLCFSATLEGPAGAAIAAHVHDPVRVAVERQAEEAASVEHRFVTVDRGSKIDTLVDELAGERGLALVFVRTRDDVDELADVLAERGMRPATLHGAMPQRARNGALARFSRGGADVMVATDVAARGLDVSGITHVVNFDPPHDDESYVHRVGRTGRAGRTGTGVTLVLPQERLRVGRMAQRLGIEAWCARTDEPILDARAAASARRPRGSYGGGPRRDDRRGYGGRPYRSR